MASSTVRVQQHRLRKAGCEWAPLKCRSGRRKQANVLPSSLQRRRRREAKLAERTLRSLVQQMLRLRLIAKKTLVSASNVRRMLRGAPPLQAQSGARHVRAMALWGALLKSPDPAALVPCQRMAKPTSTLFFEREPSVETCNVLVDACDATH